MFDEILKLCHLFTSNLPTERCQNSFNNCQELLALLLIVHDHKTKAAHDLPGLQLTNNQTHTYNLQGNSSG